MKLNGNEPIHDPNKLSIEDYESVENLVKQKKPIIKIKEPNRNSLCPCGSGLKYKKCCMQEKRKTIEMLNEYYK